MAFIHHHAPVQGLSDERVALSVTPSHVLRTAGQQVAGETHVETIEDLQRFVQRATIKWQDHEEVHVRVLVGTTFGMGPEENHSIGVKLAPDALAHVADVP
jgi:hypothetical protein